MLFRISREPAMDFADRGLLDETLVVVASEFGRMPIINRRITLPEEAPGSELSWMKAYSPRCRGRLNPQRWLPEHVDKK